MCNFSNNNQSATATYNPLDNQQTAPTALELIKMAAELAAIDNAADTAFYSPIPINANFNVNIGDLNISCSITNNAARDVDLGNKQATTQQESKATSTTSNQQQATDHQQPHEPQHDMFQLPEKFRGLYSLITDFLGSYTKVKISIAPGCSTDSIRLGFINKGESVVKGERPFFGVESVSMQRYFSKNFEYFSIFPRGDAFSVTIKGDEVAVSKLMRMVEEHINNNKRNVEWARYNN